MQRPQYRLPPTNSCAAGVEENRSKRVEFNIPRKLPHSKSVVVPGAEPEAAVLQDFAESLHAELVRSTLSPGRELRIEICAWCGVRGGEVSDLKLEISVEKKATAQRQRRALLAKRARECGTRRVQCLMKAAGISI